MPTLRENYLKRSENLSFEEIDLRIFLSTIFPGPGMDLPAARDIPTGTVLIVKGSRE